MFVISVLDAYEVSTVLSGVIIIEQSIDETWFVVGKFVGFSGEEEKEKEATPKTVWCWCHQVLDLFFCLYIVLASEFEVK